MRRLAALFFILGITPLTFDLGQGYPNGAPNKVPECDTLMPGHGPDFQNSKSPYDVLIAGEANNGSYDATQNISVRISGTDGVTFKGFILQARQYSGSEYVTVGSFDHPPNAKITCQSFGVVGSSVTHTENSPKTKIEFTWISPINATGNVQFSGTIVESTQFFWRIEPEISSTPQPENTTMEVPINTTGVDVSECGRTKGCYLSNCPDPNSVSCEYGVTWLPSTEADGGTAFELFGSITFTETPYVALGLSFDVIMGDDSVTDCLYNPNTGSVDVQMSWNIVGNNYAIDQKHLSLVNGSLSGYFVDGLLVCRFTRVTYPPSANGTYGWTPQQRAENRVYYPGSDVYHLMIAKGIVSGGQKLKHYSNPTVSATKINLTQIANASGEVKLSPMKKAHGIMMIFAWMVFASFGILMPRYFKTAWPTKTWKGKAIWFQLHQPLMIITLILTSAAFIVIFVSEGQYSKLDGAAAAHPPLGIIVMSLVLINPIMAVFRPAPDAKRRWIFNIFHFCVGLVAHLSATATLFLAMYITTLNMPQWCVGVMVLYVCWHACVEITLAIHMHYTQWKLKQRNASKYEVTTSGFNFDSQTQIHEDVKKASPIEAYSLFRTSIAGLHLLGVMSCAVAISVQIAIL